VALKTNHILLNAILLASGFVEPMNVCFSRIKERAIFPIEFVIFFIPLSRVAGREFSRFPSFMRAASGPSFLLHVSASRLPYLPLSACPTWLFPFPLFLSGLKPFLMGGVLFSLGGRILDLSPLWAQCFTPFC